MKQELRIFFTALMFYTRIPCPSWVDHSEDYLNKATRYFPLIGWIVGGAAALVFWIGQFVFPLSISVVLSVIAGVLITGAFHEDGFADVCDGFGGGWTKEKILDIMKDSRIGAYGMIGSVLLFALKIVTLAALAERDVWFCIKALILAHVLSRFTAVSIIYTHEYSRMDATSKVKPVAKKLSLQNLLISAIWLAPAFFLFLNPLLLTVLLPVFAVRTYLARYFQKWIDGYTGDCLGAVQQVAEIIILLSCLALWRFI